MDHAKTVENYREAVQGMPIGVLKHERDRLWSEITTMLRIRPPWAGWEDQIELRERKLSIIDTLIGGHHGTHP